MHVQSNQLQTVTAHHGYRQRHVVEPDAMLAMLAARVGLIAVSVAETRIDPQPHTVAFRRMLPHAFKHIERPGVDRDAVLDHGGQRRVIDEIRRKNHALRIAIRCKTRRETADDFAQRHRIDHRSFVSHQLQDMHVRARLLRITDHVEAAQLGDTLADHVGAVDPQGSAVLTREFNELLWIESGHDSRLSISKYRYEQHDAENRSFSKIPILRHPIHS
jgi:hypothetical protein